MEPINKILLKNGIREMISKNENYFKKNIVQTLAFKLNESMKEVRRSIGSQILMEPKFTENSNELQNFIHFCESFKPGRYTFKDEFVLNITESDIENIKWLFEHLGPEKRKEMVQNIFASPSSFKQHLDFSNSVKGKL
jgi:hypothetical protein